MPFYVDPEKYIRDGLCAEPCGDGLIEKGKQTAPAVPVRVFSFRGLYEFVVHHFYHIYSPCL